MIHLDFFKKFKRFKLLEPSLSLVGFSLVAFLFISCFFYVDYSAVIRGLRSKGITLSGLHFSSISATSSSSSSSSFPSSSSSPSSSILIGHARVDFLDQDGDGCDVFDGNWVWDESYPLYSSTNCSFLDSGFRCSENGRSDIFYSKWRWQPKNCNLPRFPLSLSSVA